MLPKNQASVVKEYAVDSGYKESPTDDQITKGVVPLDTLPAQWWNFLWNQMTTQHNLSVATTTSILHELQNVLTLAGITPDEATETQLAEAIKKLTLDVIGNLSDLEFDTGEAKTVVGALNALYTVITDDIGQKVQSLTEAIAEETTAREAADTALNDAITAEAAAREAEDTGLDERVTAIEGKIPGAASSTNKLTDEAFVLRHVATNTANFRGEWPTWEDVPTEGDQYPVDYSGNHNPTENDYMVVRDASDYNDDKHIVQPSYWETKDWGSKVPTNQNMTLYATSIWHDNDGHTYYSLGVNQWELVDGEWVDKDWGDRCPVNGANIWHDESGNIYYTYSPISSNPYSRRDNWKLVNGVWELNTDTTAIPLDTNNNSYAAGSNVWNDADGNAYYSYGDSVYLKLVNGQWVPVAWGNRRPIYAYFVWHDNEGHIYYNNKEGSLYFSYEFVNGAWVNKSWGEKKPSKGAYVWHDTYGNIFCSEGSVQLQLVNGEWVDKDWNGTFNAYGDYVWNSNDGTYFSYEERQYQLVPPRSEAYYKGTWQFKYAGDWATKGKAGWEPEFALGSLVDYDELDERYAQKATVETIEEKIPEAASATNQLADKAWVSENAAFNPGSLDADAGTPDDTTEMITGTGTGWVRRTLSTLWNWIVNKIQAPSRLFQRNVASASDTSWLRLISTLSSGDVYPVEALLSNGHKISFGIGSGHSNKGIYCTDEGGSFWLIRSGNDGTVYIDAPKGLATKNGLVIPTSQPSNLVDGSIWMD